MKPRLLFFRYKYQTDAPRFMVSHSDEQVRCLTQHFDVTVVAEDGDYAELCDRFQPDLAVFEVGLQLRRAARLRISNIQAHPGLARVGLLNADPWGATRGTFLSDLDYLGLEAVFCIGTTTGAHFPEIADQILYWPNFIDPDVFRDYRQDKVVPLTLAGALNSSYPWRTAVFKNLAGSFPSLAIPHLGYLHDTPGIRMPTGESYARLLNLARMAPTCGTVAGELVRKHLEIPACRTALITEDTPAIRAAGFRDMETCVFATESNVVSRVAELLSAPDDLLRITNAGYELVHSRHTIRHRTQVYDWFQLRQCLRPGQRIVQSSPFLPPTLVPASTPTSTVTYGIAARHLVEISAGYEAVSAGRIELARQHFQQALEYFDTLAEARLGLAICSLCDGSPHDAIYRVAALLKDTLARHADVDPDPAEWAHLIVCYLCLGKVGGACRRAAQYAHLRHPDLDRIRDVLLGQSAVSSSKPVPTRSRKSLHRPIALDDAGWQEYLARVLQACGQSGLVGRMARGRLHLPRFSVRVQRAVRRLTDRASAHVFGSRAAYLPGSGRLRGFDNPMLLRTCAQRVVAAVGLRTAGAEPPRN